MKKNGYRFVLLSALFFLIVACSNNENEAGDQEQGEEETDGATEALEIYTTIFPLEDFANKIGGEYVHVTNLVPVGADAHTFEPTARDMISVAEGDAFIYNGAGLEGFAAALIDTINGETVAIVEAAKNIDLIDTSDTEPSEEGHAHEEGESHAHEEEHAHEEDAHAHEEEHAHEGEDAHGHSHDQDPHVWLDPILSISMAEEIKNALIELMPEQEETFSSNFAELKAELEALDAEFTAMVEQAEKDTFLVSHAGYGYWERRYGLTQVGISGISPTSEPSQRELQRIIEFAKENNLQHVMFEQNISTKVAEVVTNEVGAEPLYLHNLEALVEEDVQQEEDYFSLMRQNIESLRTALQ
ncbi:metal ABC transporter solute-binding protein, Zn/Mn family [Halalkalibacter oceani]|uniref:metal ABC transporter solute-binding protein, Zn/Mn family n=1 Tax=Halalkalibacter oceani TaxID=1653776 RepID=UPI0033988E67